MQRNVLPTISGFFDIEFPGSKQLVSSFITISTSVHLHPGWILYITDNVYEAEAAHGAGLKVALCRRPGSEPLPASYSRNRLYCEIFDLNELFLEEDSRQPADPTVVGPPSNGNLFQSVDRGKHIQLRVKTEDMLFHAEVSTLILKFPIDLHSV